MIQDPRCPIHGTVVEDGWCQVTVGGEPHAVIQQRRAIHILPDGESVQIDVTPEGLIIDCVDRDGDVVGTFANTFDELFDWIAGEDHKPAITIIDQLNKHISYWNQVWDDPITQVRADAFIEAFDVVKELITGHKED